MRRALCVVAALVLLLVGACERSVRVKRIEPPGVAPIPVEVPTDDKADLGWYPAIRRGPEGAIHIAYCDVTRGDVRYGRRGADNVLRLETAAAEGAVGKYIALAVDGADAPHLLFHDQDNKYLMYTTKTPEGWQQEKVVWGPEIGMASRLLLHDGRAFAIFYDSRNHLRLAERATLEAKPIGADEAWTVEQAEEAGGGWSVLTDLAVVGDELVASYMNWNFISSELRIGRRPLAGGEWTSRVLWPARKKTPGWMTCIIQGEPKGLSLVFTTIHNERVFFGPIPETGDMRDTPVIGHFLNRMRALRAENGDLVLGVSETGKGRLGNGTLAVIRRRGGEWTRYTVDARRPVGSQLDVEVGPGGEAIILYYSDIDRGLYLYDESVSATRVEGARPSPTKDELGTPPAPAAPTHAPRVGPTPAPAAAPAPAPAATPAPAPAAAPAPAPAAAPAPAPATAPAPAPAAAPAPAPAAAPSE